jgi:hypothetical protein
MKSKTIPFFNLTSQKQIASWIKPILHDPFYFNQSLKDVHPEWDKLKVFFCRHPRTEKIYDVKIMNAPSVIDKNVSSFKGICFYVKTSPEAQWDNVSYHVCISPHKYNNLTNRLTVCFRREISDQIYKFKCLAFETNNDYCAISGKKLKFHDCHVDHKKKFRHLLQDFLKQENLKLEDIKTERIKEIFVIKSKEIISKWEVFHEKQAELRLLEPLINLKLH